MVVAVVWWCGGGVVWCFDVAGPVFVMRHLFAGNLLDYQAKGGELVDRGWCRVPVVTCLAFAGLASVALDTATWRPGFVAPTSTGDECVGDITDGACDSTDSRDANNKAVHAEGVARQASTRPIAVVRERDIWVAACFVTWIVLFCGRGP